MFNKNISAVLSFLALASSVVSVHAADTQAVVSATAPSAVVDAQACSKPDYPTRWVEDGASGKVVMDVLVSPDGTVLESRLVQSSGYRGVDKASARAVERCRMTVLQAQGSPAWSRLTYAWVIE